ncbi:MAG: hpch/hpai aldolase [Proteobacteria bacterium]|nr:hpch/hpai aldolase [Pseudomonadota bacterium]
MAQANLKRLFASAGLKVGHAIFEFDTPGIGQIVAAAGVDFVFLDMEHSGFGFMEVKRVITALRAADIAALVRPPSNAYHHIARALDVGADGLAAPMVSSKAEAEEIVAHMKYPPQGHRGVALGIAHDRYRPGPTDRKLAAANRRTALAALIETAEGIENIDQIAAVKGVDCLWIGHFDLSAALGIAGQFDHPAFAAAADRVRRAARKHGKALARLAADAQGCAALYREGFDVVCYSGDLWVYQQALIDGVAALRAGCAKTKPRGAKSAR